MNSTTAIFFDLDGTLIDEQLAMQALERQVGLLLTSSVPKDFNFASALLLTEEKNIPFLGYGIASYAWSFAQTVQQLSPDKHVFELILSEFGAFLREFFAGNIQIISGALKSVQDLKAWGCEIHIISRGIDIEQKHKVMSTGFYKFVDSITVVQDTKKNSIKKIMEARDLDYTRCCMVGDSLKGDILPALQIGIKAILVHPPNPWVHDRSDIEIPNNNPNFRNADNLDDVPLLVRQLIPHLAPKSDAN